MTRTSAQRLQTGRLARRTQAHDSHSNMSAFSGSFCARCGLEFGSQALLKQHETELGHSAVLSDGEKAAGGLPSVVTCMVCKISYDVSAQARHVSSVGHVTRAGALDAAHEASRDGSAAGKAAAASPSAAPRVTFASSPSVSPVLSRSAATATSRSPSAEKAASPARGAGTSTNTSTSSAGRPSLGSLEDDDTYCAKCGMEFGLLQLLEKHNAAGSHSHHAMDVEAQFDDGSAKAMCLVCDELMGEALMRQHRLTQRHILGVAQLRERHVVDLSFQESDESSSRGASASRDATPETDARFEAALARKKALQDEAAAEAEAAAAAAEAAETASAAQLAALAAGRAALMERESAAAAAERTAAAEAQAEAQAAKAASQREALKVATAERERRAAERAAELARARESATGARASAAQVSAAERMAALKAADAQRTAATEAWLAERAARLAAAGGSGSSVSGASTAHAIIELLPQIASDPSRNCGVSLNSKAWAWVTGAQVNRPAVELRCETHKGRRTVKKRWQLGWLLRVVSVLDLTTLAGDDTWSNVSRLCFKAARPVRDDLLEALALGERKIAVGAVCVYPSRVADAAKALASINASHIPIAAVATGFPAGQISLTTRVTELREAIAAGATEIDVVIARELVIGGRWKDLYDELRTFREACGDAARLKVILAVGELPTLRDVYRASLVAMFAGADFIKTSTGKEAINATLPVGLVMIRAIRDYFEQTGQRVGFKPAGGIRSAKDAVTWLTLMYEELGEAWTHSGLFRIGASTLITDIERQLEHGLSSFYAADHYQPMP